MVIVSTLHWKVVQFCSLGLWIHSESSYWAKLALPSIFYVVLALESTDEILNWVFIKITLQQKQLSGSSSFTPWIVVLTLSFFKCDRCKQKHFLFCSWLWYWLACITLYRSGFHLKQRITHRLTSSSHPSQWFVFKNRRSLNRGPSFRTRWKFTIFTVPIIHLVYLLIFLNKHSPQFFLKRL